MTTINEVTTLTVEDGIAVVSLNSPPVNALSAGVRDGLFEAMKAVATMGDVKAVVLICEGRTFIAGADIREFGGKPKGASLPAVLDMLEGAPVPVVAAIHGTALGGGLEVALACHYRVAVPQARCGLPEIKLGLIPGAGGTQRLPRLIGAEKALAFITSGDPVDAGTAHDLGIVDEIVSTDLRAGALAFAARMVAEGRPLKKIRDMEDKLLPAREDPSVFDAFRKANARKFRGRMAPELAIRSIEAAVMKPFDEGLQAERDAFLQLVTSVESAAQRYVFFAEREVAKIPDVPADTPTRAINRVGVLGAGTMGGGIAMNFANAGIPVTIVERDAQPLDRGLGVVRRNYENTAKRGRITSADVETRMGLLSGSVNFDDLKDCDLVIEAVFENMDVKKDVFGRLDKIAKPGAILATNTSYLNVNEIAACTSRPESVIGLHFFSPANVMRLLEIVRGEKTSKDVIATCMKMGKQIGKVAALVGVCHGFVGNRMLAQRQAQATALVSEGVMPWDVDRVLYDFGFPMGPFAMGDLAGLDIGWSKETSKGETIRELLCEMDRRGQKTGAGFYDYDDKRNAVPSPVTEKLIRDFVARSGATPRQVSDEEILERCVYPMINEGAKILEEGIAIRASDIDIVWINGYGWPSYRGGPMFYGDTIGLDKVLERMKHYESQYGAFFKPAPLLEKHAAAGTRMTG